MCECVSVCVCVCVCVSCTGKGAEIRKQLPELPSDYLARDYYCCFFFWTITSYTLKLSICYKIIAIITFYYYLYNS